MAIKFPSIFSRKPATEAQCATPPKARVPERYLPKDGGACWLEKTNPLIGLSIRTAQSIFDAARNGDTQRLHWIYQEIEAANPILFIGTERRQSAIANFQWDVAARPNADEKLAEEQRQAVDEFLLGIPNLTKLLEHLDTAWFRGFAYAQPIWNEDGSLAEIVLHNSWEFLRKDGILFHNPSCNGWSRDCVSCEDAGLIGVECNRAIDYPALAIHIRHAVGERDWGRFLERYALPKPAVTMAANATNDQRNDYIIAAKAVENGQVSVWPNGTGITDFAGGSRGTDPFDKFIGHQEKLIILLATGGTLTSLAQSDTGALAGGAQMEVWKEIVGRDAGVLSQAVMQSLVRPFLERRFWGRPISVDFSLNIPKKLSPKEAAEVAGLCRNAGYTVVQKELEKAVGFTLIPYEGPGIGDQGSDFRAGFGAARKHFAAAREAQQDNAELLAAFAKDTSEAGKAVAEFLKNPTPEAAEDLLKRLPDLMPEDPAMAAVIAEAMAKEFKKEDK